MSSETNIGKRFLGWNGETYICADYHDMAGYIMVNESDPSDERCISERAIGRTFHALPSQADGAKGTT